MLHQRLRLYVLEAVLVVGQLGDAVRRHVVDDELDEGLTASLLCEVGFGVCRVVKLGLLDSAAVTFELNVGLIAGAATSVGSALDVRSWYAIPFSSR